MSNDDQLKFRQTASKKKSFKELIIVRDIIFWIDLVGEVQNENAIFARPFNEKESFPQKLTSKKYNFKNNFHGYGGKSYKCIYLKNNSEKKLQDAIFADERAIDLACRFGYSIPNAYKSLGGALKELIEKTRKKKKRSIFEDRLEALRKSAEKARSELSQQEGSDKSVSSENVYGQ